MPEGDSLHRAARRLQVLVGEQVEVETPHPRAAVKGLAERLDGRRLEALWEARVSPWRRLEDVGEAELRAVLERSHTLMRESVDGHRPPRRVYRRAGRACPRCGGVIRSAPQGDNARTAYWCPACQVGGNAPPS